MSSRNCLIQSYFVASITLVTALPYISVKYKVPVGKQICLQNRTLGTRVYIAVSIPCPNYSTNTFSSPTSK